ncbi:MAG: hypothetical protein GQ574_05765 [Crocinitomix sp.]|nr:hypothetical protein [Crocinitomix sp.]
MNNSSSEPTISLDPKINELIEQSPSVIRNSLIVRPTQIITQIIGYLLFLGGIGMIIDSQIRAEFFDKLMHELYNVQPEYQSELTPDLILYAGIALISIGLLFLFISRLTRMIRDRNKFNLRLWERRQELIDLKKAEEKVEAEKEALKNQKQSTADNEAAASKESEVNKQKK